MRIAFVLVVLAGVAMGQVSPDEAARNMEQRRAERAPAIEAENRQLKADNQALREQVAALVAEIQSLKLELSKMRDSATSAPAGPTTSPTSATTDATDGMMRPIRVGNAEFVITGARVGRVPLLQFGQPSHSNHSLLMISLTIKNLSDTQKLSYRTWAGADLAIGHDYATLKDELGNEYNRVSFGLVDIVGRTRAASIYPGDTISDVLVFEVPVSKATTLDMELPGANIGGTELIHVVIPAGGVVVLGG